MPRATAKPKDHRLVYDGLDRKHNFLNCPTLGRSDVQIDCISAGPNGLLVFARQGATSGSNPL